MINSRRDKESVDPIDFLTYRPARAFALANGVRGAICEFSIAGSRNMLRFVKRAAYAQWANALTRNNTRIRVFTVDVLFESITLTVVRTTPFTPNLRRLRAHAEYLPWL